MFVKEINNMSLLELRHFKLVSLELLSNNIIFNAYHLLERVKLFNILFSFKLKYLGYDDL